MHYLNVSDIDNISQWIEDAKALKKTPYKHETLGRHKTIGLLFFNPSLRTRMSTQKAAQNLGMNVITLNLNSDGWKIEFEDGATMNHNTSEHIKEAAAVMSQYCDIIAIRAFSNLENRNKDSSEYVINNFKKYASVPILNMESATGHPLQALTDAITISEETINIKRPKVVLTWTPHTKALPHAVSNSFIQMMQRMSIDFCIANPEGFDLCNEIVKDTPIFHSQQKAFKNADIIYAKNWSSYQNYGQITNKHKDWMISNKQMQLTNNAKFMHCLPVRRNVVVADEVLDSPQSIVIQQANNRTYAAQLAIKKILAYGK